MSISLLKTLKHLPLLLLTGCASIMHGTRQTVGISSYPSDAEVWIDNQYIGQSPTVIELKRNENHAVRIELKGYLPYEVTLTHEVSGWVFGNIVFGGVIGLAVDAITGGLYELTPDQLQVELRKGNIATTMQNDEMYIAAVMVPDPSWKKIDNMRLATR